MTFWKQKDKQQHFAIGAVVAFVVARMFGPAAQALIDAANAETTQLVTDRFAAREVVV